MRTQQHGEPESVPQIEDLTTKFNDALGIEPIGRLIKDEELGLRQQCLGEGEALTHPVTVGRDPIVDAFLESDPGDRFPHH